MYHLTDHNFHGTYFCEVCPQFDPDDPTEFIGQIFTFDSWYQHLMDHMKDAYLQILELFSHAPYERSLFYVPLTPGGHTYSPYKIVVTVKVNGTNITKEKGIDFSFCANLLYLHRTIESIAQNLYYDLIEIEDEKMDFVIRYSVDFLPYQQLPSFHNFKNTEVLKIPKTFSYASFYPLSFQGREIILRVHQKTIINAIDSFFNALSYTNTIYQQFSFYFQSSIPFYFVPHGQFSIEGSFNLEVCISDGMTNPFKWIHMPNNDDIHAIGFNTFLYECLSFVDKNSHYKFYYNLLQSLYYLSILPINN